MRKLHVYGIIAVALSVAALPGCGSDDSSSRAGTVAGSSDVHPSDVNHPDWKLHPDAILLQDIDEDLIYDLKVDGKIISFPLAGHESLVEKLVPKTSILVSRANEEDTIANPGFIRAVLAISKTADRVELTTAALPLKFIVRGHFSNDQKNSMSGYMPSGLTGQNKSLNLQKKFGSKKALNLPLSLDKDLNVKIDGGETAVGTVLEEEVPKGAPARNFEASTSSLSGISYKAEFDGHIHLQPQITAFLDVHVDIPWWRGLLDVVTIGAAEGAFILADDPIWDKIEIKSAKAGVGLEFEVQGALDFELAGFVRSGYTREYFKTDYMPACNIGGVPCHVNGSVTLDCALNLEGAIAIKTTKKAKVSGTPTIGVEYSSKDGFSLLKSNDGINKEEPEFSYDMPAGLAITDKTVYPEGTTQIQDAQFSVKGSSYCRLQPKVELYFGEDADLKIAKVAVGGGAYLQLGPEVDAALTGCLNWSGETHKVTPALGLDFDIKRTAYVGAHFDLIKAGLIAKEFQVWEGDPIFHKHFGSNGCGG